MATDRIDKIRQVVEGNFGYSRWVGLVLEPQLPAYSIAGEGDFLLSEAIKCLIVGMSAEGRQLLEKSDRWLSAALERARAGERLGIEDRSHHGLSLCRWLAGPPAEPHDLTRCRALLREHLAGPDADCRVTWDATLPRMLDVGEVEHVLVQFEHHRPRHLGLARGLYGESRLAYLLARERSGRPALPGVELASLCDAFLTRQVPALLDGGRYEDCALWVKLLTGAGPGEPAREALRQTAERYA